MIHKRDCKFIAAVTAAVLLLSGCNSRNNEPNGSNAINIPPIISKAINSKSSPAAASVAEEGSHEVSDSSESTVDIESTADIESSIASSEQIVSSAISSNTGKSDKKWEEWEYNADLYINGRVNGRVEPLEGSTPTRTYELDEPVSVVAYTSTQFFKLDNGDYIFAEYFSSDKVFSSETVRTELTYKPPVDVGGETVYDPKAVLDYAKAHWQDEESLCAGFGSECLTAGGLSFDETSSTRLFNRLTAAKLGYSVAIDLNDDGTATVPDYVYPGDIIFYYCKAENMMVHTAMYNGDTKDGIMKAYAHNLADNGEEPFRYFKYCVGGCGCELDKIVAFCFYRDKDSIALPTNTPKLSAKVADKKVDISWQADFVYRSSVLVVTDNKGNVFYRKPMGTDLSETLALSRTGDYVAYVEFTVYDDIKIKSDNLVFKI